MPIITFVHPDGTIQKTNAVEGDSLLKVALECGVPMEHACGGNGFCTTCMCDVAEGGPNLSPRNSREENMGVTEDPKRLGCQVKVLGDATIRLLDS